MKRPELNTCDANTARITVGFQSGFTIIATHGGACEIRGPHGVIPVTLNDSCARAALQMVAVGNRTDDEIFKHVIECGTQQSRQDFLYCYLLLLQKGILTYCVWDGASLVAECHASGASFPCPMQTPVPGIRYRLSRFALVRRDAGRLWLEAATSTARVLLQSDFAVKAVAALGDDNIEARVYPAGAQSFSESEAHRALLCVLLSCGFLTEVVPEVGGTKEELDDDLRTWSFHDLLFHSRSRFGRHYPPFGATFRHLGEMTPAPVARPTGPQPKIQLARPDLLWLQKNDTPFTCVLERRRSNRKVSHIPLSLDMVGEFLYRTARIRERSYIGARNSFTGETGGYEISSRPYPSGGASYELELYLTFNACDGLERGVYHYDPLGHSLEHVCPICRKAEQLLSHATLAARLERFPQILITFAARFQRVAWKYDSIAYAVIMKNVGALYQTMYLVGTAMGIGCCALGSGNSDLFADMTGNQYYRETSVGEFVIGTASDDA